MQDPLNQPLVATGPAPEASRPGRTAALFDWGVWALMLLSALAYVGEFGRNLPLWDDYTMVPAITGRDPVSLAWLWDPNNEHRIPLPKLLFLGLYRLAGRDFRAPMFFDVPALAASAAGLIMAARRLRGRTNYGDVLFPIGLLHWGHYENLLWAFQIGFVLPTALTGALLAVIVWWGAALPLRWALAAGACLLLLPLCGANGVAVVPALAVWLGYGGVCARRSGAPHGRRNGGVMLAFSAAGLLLTGLYFLGFETPAAHPDNAGAWPTLVTGAEFLATAFGAAGRELWPWSAVVVPSLLLAGVAAAVAVWRRRPAERGRVLGLALFVGGLLCLAAGLAWGRSGFGGGAGLAPRYTTLATPLLFALYFLGQLHPTPAGRRAALVPACLLGAALVLNAEEGLTQGRLFRERADCFERDLRGGTPAAILASEYTPGGPLALYGSTRGFYDLLAMLYGAGIEPFRELQDIHDFDASHEECTPDGIIGWAWDRLHPDAVVSVDVFEGRRLLGTVPADLFREDLLESAMGNGRHGFRLPLPPYLRDGLTHSIRVKLADTQVRVENTPQKLVCPPGPWVLPARAAGLAAAAPLPGPGPLVAAAAALQVPLGEHHDYQGHHEVADASGIAGWVWDRLHPARTVAVDVFDGDELISTVAANRFRDDLRRAGIGDGRHAFALPLPDAVQGGKPHRVRVRVSGIPFNLEDTPKLITLEPQAPGSASLLLRYRTGALEVCPLHRSQVPFTIGSVVISLKLGLSNPRIGD